MKRITEDLFAMQDMEYREFCVKLTPNLPSGHFIGVRTPALRKYAKKAAAFPEIEEFLATLPHTYYEENNLHGAVLGILYREVEQYLAELEKFLPYIDNWATCDMLSPKVFRQDLPLVYPHVKKWLNSGETYTVRFGIVTLLGYYLEEAFTPEILRMVAAVKSDEYYVKMAVAWFFSVALVKQYEDTVLYFTEPVLDKWTHNKAIQKAVESYRIPTETKAYLKCLRR